MLSRSFGFDDDDDGELLFAFSEDDDGLSRLAASGWLSCFASLSDMVNCASMRVQNCEFLRNNSKLEDS